jgi:hypothetical protein
MRGRLIVVLIAILVVGALLSRGNRRGKYLAGKGQQLRRAFLAAATICLGIDLFAIASGGVSGVGDVIELLATTVVPFTYLYWRFGGSYKFRRE